MKVCVLSDIHGDLIDLDPCDLVLICGDNVPLNVQGSSKKTYKWYSKIFYEWAMNLPCEKVIFIAGNHDVHLENHYKEYKELFSNDNKVTYLCHERYDYKYKDNEVYSIFGSPYCNKFGNWAFMETDEILKELYSQIPNGLDILITHDQPYLYGDILLQKDFVWATGEHIGNPLLLETIKRCSPKWQFNGHLHSCDHSMLQIENTYHFNVSIKDEFYKSVYKPLYLIIE